MEQIVEGVIVESADASFDEKRVNPVTQRPEKTGKRIEVWQIIVALSSGTFEPLRIAKYLDDQGTPNPMFAHAKTKKVNEKIVATKEGRWNNFQKAFEFKHVVKLESR